MEKESQEVKKNIESTKDDKNLIIDEGTKKFLFEHLEPQKLDFDKVKNCILNNIYEDDDFISNNRGLNLFPEINESFLNDLGIVSERTNKIRP